MSENYIEPVIETIEKKEEAKVNVNVDLTDSVPENIDENTDYVILTVVPKGESTQTKVSQEIIEVETLPDNVDELKNLVIDLRKQIQNLERELTDLKTKKPIYRPPIRASNLAPLTKGKVLKPGAVARSKV
ncbi:hypothetical protein HK096_007387 [Nowakowskiella sp. JEL0078]|nr:hypothetical protein HK096_007387 [Nowakowskiella sp. JEL0078]